MTRQPSRPGFAARPTEVEAWIRAPEPTTSCTAADTFSARLTVDVTPDLRGRIKVAAFQRGLTMADLLRALLDREFSDDKGGAE